MSECLFLFSSAWHDQVESDYITPFFYCPCQQVLFDTISSFLAYEGTTVTPINAREIFRGEFLISLMSFCATATVSSL